MKVSLTIADRISLTQLLPGKDSFENLLLRESILEKIKFLPEEIEGNIIKSERDQITWKETEPKEFDIVSAEITYIFSNLKRISEAKELTALQLPLYKLFSTL